MTRAIRVLGLATSPIANFRSQPNAKSTGLYAALDRRFGVAGIVQPEMPRVNDYLNKLRHVHRDRVRWRAQVDLNPWAFQQRTEAAEQDLRRWDGKYDLIMQLHTLLSPGHLTARRAYTLHTDNTYMLSDRYYPWWAPLRGQQRDAWLDLERRTYQHAAFLFPRSEFVRRSMIEDYGCDPERVIAVGGGANLAAASLTAKAYDRQIALFVGGDFERKGGHVLLEAWPAVRRAVPDAQLWIVGPKKQLAPNQPGVRWYGRIQDRHMLAELYMQATLFVMPSLFEPWGHVFLEAMGYGLGCIGSNHCAMPEIIEHNRTGLLVPPNTHEPLAHALIEVLGNPERAEAMGRAAHAYVLHGNTWDDVVDRMAPYIEQAVAEPHIAFTH